MLKLKASLVTSLLLLLLSAAGLQAATIVSVMAPPGLSTLVTSTRALTTSWSTTQTYTNVSIAILVNSSQPGNPAPSADAYLTNLLGPGTTAAANQIASTNFTVPATLPVCSPFGNCGAMVTLFSGLTLGPGTYYLTLGTAVPLSPPRVGWFPAPTPTIVLDSGVTLGPSLFSDAPDLGYPPASNFNIPEFPFIVEIIGTPAAVPEPGAASLVALGLALGAWLRARRSA